MPRELIASAREELAFREFESVPLAKGQVRYGPLFQRARLADAYPVIALDPLANRRAAAQTCGADLVFDPIVPFDSLLQEYAKIASAPEQNIKLGVVF